MAFPSRLSGSLPLSIAAHLAAFVVLLVIPLTAEMALPIPPSKIDDFVRAVPAPPPPPAPAPAARPQPVVASPSAPTSAPDRITPEIERIPTPGPVVEGGVNLGPPTQFGEVLTPPGPPVVPPPAPPAPKPEGPVRVGELVQTPRKIVDVRPVYPDIARAARVEGTVVLEAVLDRNGRVSQLRVVRSVPLLDEAALVAVQQWRYTPSTLHGTPVEVLMTITVSFQLQR